MSRPIKSLPATAALAIALAAGTLAAGEAQAQTVVTPAVAPAPAAPASVDMIITRSSVNLGDVDAGTLKTTTISNVPIPDSSEARKAYGGPDSAGGRATAPHPGPVDPAKQAAAEASTSAPKP